MSLRFRVAVIVTTTLAACGDSSQSPDAPAGDAEVDAPPVIPFDCETSPSSGTHKVFLQFEGVTLSHAEASDAAQDQSALVDDGGTATIPAWRAEDPDRQAHVETVVCSLRESLFPYDVEVVTTRPTNGDYEMVVIGGRGTDLGLDLAPNTLLSALAVNPCGSSANPREVSWVAEFPGVQASSPLAPIETANMAAYTLGINSLLNFSESGSNCMCSILGDEPCDQSRACEFSELSSIPPQGDLCGGSATSENQVMKLEVRYGARR